MLNVLVVRYHYYGIGVRESSKYYEIMFSRKGIQGYYFIKTFCVVSKTVCAQ